MIASKAVRRVVTTALGCAAVLGVGCASGSPHGGSVWDRQMRLGVESVNRGDPRAGVAHYEQALEAAREEPGKPNHLAYANWHLGDACFRYPESCASGEAERKTQISLALFGGQYGPEHPVVIPILLRLSDIKTQLGDPEEAEVLLEQADRITARTFPESHFMRARMGTHRPASQLHPLEILQILAEVDLLDG